jgi:excisionase family DNA binding protein
MNEMFTLHEVATRLRVSEVTLYRWIKSGKLKTKKAGRKHLITEEAIQEILK